MTKQEPAVAIPKNVDEIFSLLSFFEETTAQETVESPQVLHAMILDKIAKMMSTVGAIQDAGEQDQVLAIGNPLVKALFDWASQFDNEPDEDQLPLPIVDKEEKKD